ncbi:hypothetical protein MBT42_14650 [Streptomyces sp. MBT42]|uniref:hypothetical protein n=1 Tax=Streptomyces sp. MBT42 TaxID=1488373 RepID=UPI001E291C5E|nr:hypothetical protein [Streptomyces sp. MBT42]MCD2464796.1 hypothetical protein [Streptomyces sp. MBT42]
MIYRNFIAPSRAFSQFSHEIIRHPRLDSHAARLLTWQLSLPAHARETLSETAKRARIGATSFTTAKRQLKAEGYVHERRVQVGGGLWVTQQLVSSSPLRPEEAAKIFARMPVHSGVERVYAQVAPSTPVPAVGHPTTPSTDGHPEKHRRENTSDLPAEPGSGAGPGSGSRGEAGAASEPAPPLERKPGTELVSEPEAESESESVTEPQVPESAGEVPATARLDAQLDEARALVGALPLLSPALRHIPPGMREELTRLTARWLAAGHTSADVHEHVLRGLPGAGTPVQRPGGLVRYLLREVPPRTLPRPKPSASPPGPRLSSRLQGARECASGAHTQPMLFRPVSDEVLCSECLGWGPQGGPGV